MDNQKNLVMQSGNSENTLFVYCFFSVRVEDSTSSLMTRGIRIFTLRLRTTELRHSEILYLNLFSFLTSTLKGTVFISPTRNHGSLQNSKTRLIFDISTLIRNPTSSLWTQEAVPDRCRPVLWTTRR